MKKFAPLLMLVILFLSSIACGLSTKTAESPTAVETDACCLNDPTIPPVEEPADLEPTDSFTPDYFTPQVSGWYPYVNANVVRDLVMYNGVVHAATLGGLVTWRLDSGYSMKYTPIDGMTHVSATSIAYCEIPEPRILVGTLSGISIYDPGTGLWENRSLAPGDSGVDTSKIERMYCDQTNNRLLIGYNGLGVLDLATGDFQHFTRDQGLLWDSITDITVSGKDIWVAHGYKGIAQITNGKVTPYSADNGLPEETAYSLAFANDGTLWVGAASGLMSFKGGNWTFFGADSAAKLGNVNEIEITPDGKIWAATLPLGTGRLCQFNPQTGACDVDFTEMDGQGIQALTLTESGEPVYGTNKGVYVFENGAARAFKTDDQLLSNYVDSFGTAPDGSLWVGTDSGVQVLDPIQPDIPWTSYRQSENPGMGGAWISGIAFDSYDAAWMAVINGSATRYQQGQWTSFEDVYSFNTVTVDPLGHAWFGDDGKGIIVLDQNGEQVMKLTTAEGLPGDNVQALLTDSAGRVWIGTDQGLAKYENETLEVVFGQDDTQLPNKYIRALTTDWSGALFIGTFTGVARYDGTQVVTLVDFIKDGYSDARLTALAVTGDGWIWVGTDKGLLTSDGTGWTRLTIQDGLLTNYISALHVDPYDDVWVGGGGSNFDGGGLLQIVP